MHYLYILVSLKAKRRYIGITENLEERIAKHNAGKVISTKAYKPWKLAYQEEFSDKTSVRKREIFLKKTAKARKDLFDKLDTAPSSSGQDIGFSSR
ncbi:MAG: GIY-YIG nuclease family protein [Candidatus Liptonbacteria bacterium]|nr:GIY-YIG nuclease family protein [Candidatus Liptonbacteria bacterium]